jgi:hypothetical protein
MYKSNSGFAPHRRQGGFIQGAILFALVIIAVVVAAFSLANQDNQTNADSEEARVNATYVLKVGNDVQAAINRAIADGVAPAEVHEDITFTGTSDDGQVGLWDPDLRYLAAAPRFPPAVQGGATPPALAWVGTPVSTGAGDAGVEQVVTIANVSRAVCWRINNVANGTLPGAAPPATLAAATTTAAAGTPALLWREGCFGDNAAAAAHTYFRVVVVDAA